MFRSGIVLLLVLLFGGCSVLKYGERQENFLKASEKRLQEAIPGGTISCQDKTECDKIFDLVKLYITNNAQMKVAPSDGQTIATEPPVNRRMGMIATLQPGQNGSATITLRAYYNDQDCKLSQAECNNAEAAIYDEFSTSIKKRLNLPAKAKNQPGTP